MHGSINPEKVQGLTQTWLILNFIKWQTKLQYLCSVEPKDASRISKMETKLGHFFIYMLI